MRPDTKYRPIKLNIYLSKGGLGDSIARLPAINYLLSAYPHIEHVQVFCQDYFVEFGMHLLRAHAGRVQLYGYSMQEEVLGREEAASEQRPAMMTDSVHHTTMRTHLTDHAFHTLTDSAPLDAKWKNYLKAASMTRPTGLPKEYVVVTTGFTAANREWLPGYVNEVVKASPLPVVFLGKNETAFYAVKGGTTEATFRTEVEFDRGLNLVDKTDLFEACNIMAHAKAVLGVDNGLLHLAACTDVPIVAGYTSVSPLHRMPYRRDQLGWNVYPVGPDLACKFCQTQMGFVYHFDFRRCYYNDYTCVKEITPDKFIRGLEWALGNSEQKVKQD